MKKSKQLEEEFGKEQKESHENNLKINQDLDCLADKYCRLTKDLPEIISRDNYLELEEVRLEMARLDRVQMGGHNLALYGLLDIAFAKIEELEERVENLRSSATYGRTR